MKLHLSKKKLQAASLVAACITLLMVLSIIKQINATNLQLNNSLIGMPRQTYDILVRPHSSLDQIETQFALVNPNHLNGINGGITFDQYDQIKKMRGVEIAAPIAMMGYFNQKGNSFSILDKLPWGVYKIDIKSHLNNGLEDVGTHLKAPIYGLYSPSKIDFENQIDLIKAEALKGYVYINDGNSGQNVSFTVLDYPKQILVAAIDPSEENKLVMLDTSLGQASNISLLSPILPSKSNNNQQAKIPVLLNSKNYLDQMVEIELTRLELAYDNDALVLDQINSLPDVSDLKPEMEREKYLFTYKLSENNASIVSHFSVKNNVVVSSRPFVSTISGPNQLASPIKYHTYSGQIPLTNYSQLILEAEPVGELPEQAINYTCDLYKQFGLGCPHPEEWIKSSEIEFRKKVEPSYQYIMPMKLVDKFDPQRIIEANANDLNQVPLETYAVPSALLKFDTNGKPLENPVSIKPTFNSQGFLTSPPDMLISLDSLKAIIEKNCGHLNPDPTDPMKYWLQKECPQKDGFISAIRIRVAGITTMNEAAEEKVKQLAKDITESTGLKADVMVGASLQPVLIHLPSAGTSPSIGFVEENWIKKGVTTTYRKGFTQVTSLGAIAMVLTGSVLILLMNYQAMLSFRDEFILLHTLGWRKNTIFYRQLFPTMAIQFLITVGLFRLLLFLPNIHITTISHGQIIILFFAVALYTYVLFYFPYRVIFTQKRDHVTEEES